MVKDIRERFVIKMERNELIVDFICIGFPKCGTTTLYSVLNQHSGINLARGKETSFFDWCDEFTYPLDILYDKFLRIKSKKYTKNGLIESEFYMNASDIKFYFGEYVKLIFMLRNPVQRLYSAFKMRLRQGCGSIVDLYQINRKLDTSQLFDIYCEQVICKNNCKYIEEFEVGNYIKWLREFESEFSKDNMLIIFLEDYKKDADREIRKIEEFLGVDEKRLRTEKVENEGNTVCKNFYCAKINGFFNKFYQRQNGYFVENVNIGRQWIDIRNKVYGKTLKEEHAHMSVETRKLCEQFYRKSKEELEDYVDRNLGDIWFI